MNSPVLTVNVGNTNVSAAVGTRDGVIRRLGSWPTKDWIARAPETRAEWLQVLAGDESKSIRVSCVVPAVEPVLLDWSAAADRPVRFTTCSEVPLRFEVPAPERVGIDRLINCAAAWHRFGRACLVVDMGTAVTWDLVIAPGVFVGGVIAPGLGTLALALPSRTALPFVEPRLVAEVIGRDTVSCLRSGLWFGFLAQVEGLIDRIHATLPEPPLTLLTGGTAPVVAPHLREVYPVLPDLTHEGLALIAD